MPIWLTGTPNWIPYKKMGRPNYSEDEYEKLLAKYEELKEKGYKHSGLWNKLAREFDYRWKPITILHICHRLGKYKNLKN